ncbi:hypothetical protein HOY80DRAFT_887914 [Tuber brumale]|nr:hypothetical protein HOY80DRAFT_887914 [Tuber brumale]
MGLKDCRGPGGECCTSEICTTCEHLVNREGFCAQHERVPIASRLLWSLVYEVSCIELNNCRPSHGLLDIDIPPSLINL